MSEKSISKETRTLEELIKVVRKAATDYGRIMATAATIDITITPTESITIDVETSGEGKVTWVAEVNIHLMDGIPVSEKDIVKKKETLTGSGDTLHEVFCEILNDLKNRLEGEAIRMQSRAVYLREAAVILGPPSQDSILTPEIVNEEPGRG